MSKSGAYIKLGGTALAAGYSAYQRYNNRSRSSVNEPSSMSGGNMVSRARRRTGRLKKRNANQVFRMYQRGGYEQIYRFQQTSREYLGPGRIFLGTSNIDAFYDRVPIHLISLTANQLGAVNTAKGANADVTFYRMQYQKNTGDFVLTADYPSQTYLGVNDSNLRWQTETSNSAPPVNINQVFHKWTDIKLNLYGTYTVPIHYTVTLCTLPESLDPLSFLVNTAGGPIAEGSECANMFKDMVTDQVHNNFGVNTGKSTWRRDMRVIKEYKCTIQPLAYSDQQAEGALPINYSKAAHIRELRWFVRHDRFRDYKWSRTKEETLEHRNIDAPGWDVVSPAQILADVEWGKRVFLIIRASCPIRADTDQLYMTDTLATTNGSYDVCIRNSFVYH